MKDVTAMTGSPRLDASLVYGTTRVTLFGPPAGDPRICPTGEEKRDNGHFLR